MPWPEVIRVARHIFARFLVEQPDMEPAIIDFSCRLAIDGELVATADLRDVLPVAPVEAAAIGEGATMENAMELGLRSAPIIEAVALADDPGTKPNLLG